MSKELLMGRHFWSAKSKTPWEDVEEDPSGSTTRGFDEVDGHGAQELGCARRAGSSVGNASTIVKDTENKE